MNRLIRRDRARAGLKAYFRTHPHREGIVVWPDRRLIYMKPCKTAGTSILRRCLELEMPDVVHLKDHPEAFNAWLADVTDEDLEKYFIFSFTRNPWDRIVSAAHYFNIEVNDLVASYDSHIEDDEVRIHCLPTHVYTHFGGRTFVDYVGRFETLTEDFNVICDLIGIRRRQLPHAKRTDHKHYSRYFSDHARQRVAELYDTDLAYYGYTFDEKPSHSENIVRLAHNIIRAGRTVANRLSNGVSSSR